MGVDAVMAVMTIRSRVGYRNAGGTREKQAGHH
jgi:hypothetical protein